MALPGEDPAQLRRSVSFAPAADDGEHDQDTRPRPAPLAPVLDGAVLEGVTYRTPPPSPGGRASPNALVQRSAVNNIAQGLSTPASAGSRTTNTIIALASHRSHEDMM